MVGSTTAEQSTLSIQGRYSFYLWCIPGTFIIAAVLAPTGSAAVAAAGWSPSSLPGERTLKSSVHVFPGVGILLIFNNTLQNTIPLSILWQCSNLFQNPARHPHPQPVCIPKPTQTHTCSCVCACKISLPMHTYTYTCTAHSPYLPVSSTALTPVSFKSLRLFSQ